MKIILFSRDRAFQLDALFRSFKKNWLSLDFNDINVIYTYSNEKFKEGYEILQDRYLLDFPNFYKEKDFNLDLLLHTTFLTNRSIGFFTDDCIFYRPTGLDSNFIDNMLADEQNLCLSLRLGRENSVIQNYLTGEVHKKIDEYGVTTIDRFQMFKYKWGLFPSQSNPGYIGSIDGCFYDSGYILDTIKNIDISCPRALEENLANNQKWRQEMTSKKPYMICPRRSNVVVNSINFVQTDPVSCGKIFPFSSSALNDIYVAGNVIDLDDFLNKCQDINSCHFEAPFKMVKYNG